MNNVFKAQLTNFKDDNVCELLMNQRKVRLIDNSLMNDDEWLIIDINSINQRQSKILIVRIIILWTRLTV